MSLFFNISSATHRRGGFYKPSRKTERINAFPTVGYYTLITIIIVGTGLPDGPQKTEQHCFTKKKGNYYAWISTNPKGN